MLHSSVVGDTLWSKTEAQDITRIRTVSYQERTIWFPFQLHLCIFPIHWSPIPTTLSKIKSSQVVTEQKNVQVFSTIYLTTGEHPYFQHVSVGEKLRRVFQPLAMNTGLSILLALQSYRRRILQFRYQSHTKKMDLGQLIWHNQLRLCKHFSTTFIMFNFLF